ncbi:T9SS type A sorting domain-containing protein [Flavobacterium hungaricum]|uniref:T9SS C-terminal target domain-containing protein n=1 Tax=Flavobacterium hungaricum TaxID=2082725 RepID=A0ABR9TSF9_9FLAO|nr:T9SS type A sorting domain-containing protein [Flavobacterium hungaricum]MBE8728306.1 T9SS C-terminal target domain-containing protein [Flavobacterium hungaricum]
MKNFYSQIKNFLNIALFLGIFLQSYRANAQTTLAVGDIIFTGYDSTPPTVGGNDKFSFVLLTNISAGTTISFTDRGYTGAAWRPSTASEGSVTWTSGTAIPMGTEILIVGLTASTYNPATTTLTPNGTVILTDGGTAGQGLILSNVGDQIIAFQGGTGVISGAGVTVISGITYYECGTNTTSATWDSTSDCTIGPNSSVMPPGLTGGTSAFYTGTISGTLAQSSKYNGNGAPFTTAAQIRAAVMNQANWTLSTTTLSMPSSAPFLGVPPAITGNPPNRTICNNGNTTFNVTATNATGYQWQVNTGSGFNNITNGAPYSGAPSATLTITGATSAMNGYTYRAVATGTGSATSNPATLTVSNTTVSTTSQSNVSCYGGANGVATIAATGGIAPYTYSWSPSGGTAAMASGLSAGTYTVTVTDNIGCSATHNVIITQPAIALNGTPSTTAVSCFGGANGTATIAPSGGTPGYTYLWSNGATTATATGLTAGTYSVTITDANGCPRAITGIVVGQPAAAVDGTVSTTAASCNGGSNGTATVVATGGTGAYTYVWSPTGGTGATASGLAAGTYSVTVRDANLCQKVIAGIVITQPAVLNGTINSTNVSCNGGSDGTAAVTASGGTGAYTYLWSNAATTAAVSGLVPGNYSVTITDANNCNRTINNIIITQPSVVNGTISTTAVSCFGGSNGTATVVPSGGTPGYTYLWSNGATTATATGLAAGTYSVTVTDSKTCSRTFTGIIVGQPASVIDGTISTTAVSCNGGSNGTATVVASGGTPGYTYSWSPTGGTAATATGLAAGTYTVTITDANACQKTINNITIGQPAAAVDGTISTTAVSCNGGSNGTATVTPSGGTGTYTYSWAPSGGTAATATGLAAGTYSVTITDSNLCQKIITGIVVGQPAIALNGTISTTSVACNGGSNGSAVVIPSGGTPGYTYLWSNGATTSAISGLTAGVYSVTITDANSCSRVINNITITQPSVINATIATTGASCKGGSNGSASVVATGGVPGYTYLWSNGATTATANGLSAGTYSVTITDAYACPRTFTGIVITEPAAGVDGTISTTAVSCFGGSNGIATVSPSGGTGPYTYLWAPTGGTGATASGLAAGTYSVTVTDFNNCQKTITGIVIGQPASSVDGTISTTDASCFGGSNGTATVSPSGGSGTYTYLWAPSGGTAATAAGLAAGTYSVTISDANFCQKTITGIVIGQPAVALSGTIATTSVSCFGGANGTATVTGTGGTPGYTYLWSNGATTATITGLPAGIYSVTITDGNTCSTTINNITINQPTGISANPSQVNVSCNGGANGSATVAPTGGAGSYTYLWSNGATTASINGLSAGVYDVTITDGSSCPVLQSFTIDQPAVLIASEGSKTNVSCNGGANGTATAAVTGGVTPYSYSWSPAGGSGATASGLAAGTYTVTVTDGNGCTATESFTITEPAAFTVSRTQTDVTCFGNATGSAAVTVSGATAPYTYFWAPTGGTAAAATGLAAGTYTVTITDNNLCQTTETFTISEPAPLTASSGTITNVGCFGDATGAATVNVTGGSGAYTYSWAPSGGTAATALGLAAGTYTVTVTDGNLCQITQSFTITQPAAPLSAVTATTAVSCFGGSNGTASVSVSGGTSGYTYVWAPYGGTASTAAGLAAGNYSVTITDANGCVLVENVTITEPTPFTTSISKTDVSCNGGSNGFATVTATGATAPYTYSWSPSGGNAATASGLAAGTYTVTITDSNGCTATESVTIGEPTIITAATTHIDVTCIGRTDGSATVTPTGGTGTYTYSWAPSGGTAATASGLAAGTYVVTITDANGCQATESVTISTTPDSTAPVPDVANLPDITNYCSVLSSQITIPTASDYCAGTVTATTTSPLNYTAEGTYVITWSYDDGNGNISTQNQNVKVLASPLNQVTFTGAAYTYNGNAQTVQVSNLPAGASVVYTTSPATGTSNGAVNAGVYTVTAVISPAATASNCSPVTLTAQLTINKAPQQITFPALGIKTLGAVNTFNLTAVASSNLPVTYTSTFTTPLPAATVTAAGAVTMVRPGEITITAQQSGDANYLPAVSVSQLLVIKNNDVTITKVTLGNKVFTNPAKNLYYLMECGENNVNVSFVNETNATFSPAANLTVNSPKPGIYTQNVTVTSEDGSTTATYVITVEKPFGFYDIVHQKFNNVLLVNNNPQTNGGYEFVAYQWLKNGQVIGTNQYFSAGDVLSNTLDLNADYSVKLTTKDGKVLQTCSTKLQAQNSFQIKLYPNPVQTGKTITVDADLPQSDLDNMQISLYSVSGQLITTVKSSTAQTQIQLPQTVESNMYLVVLESGSIKKSFKVIVK